MNFFLLIIFALVIDIAKAKVITVMWEWFLVPVGLVPISFGLAFGFMYLYSLLRGGPSWEDLKEHSSREQIMMYLVKVIHIVIVLAVGWIVKSAMATG